jgi:RimJ/RimL family protein N-acetyltransferase
VDSPLLAEIGFALHPGARGRGLMTAAARLVCDFGFDVVGLQVIRWRAALDNWASRRVAAATGFVFDGAVRRLVQHDGGLEDGWLATLTRDDPRISRPWLEQPQLAGAAVTLRRFRDSDIDRIVEGCSDPRTRYWLVSMPQPYQREHAVDYLRLTRELAAQALGLVWCIADPDSDRCLGSISLEGLGGYASRAEIGYWTHPQARGRGLMTEAVGLVTAHAKATGLARSIMIRCAATNTASRHVAEAAGYDQIGVQPASEPLADGSLADLVLYARSVTSVTAGHPDLAETKL